MDPIVEIVAAAEREVLAHTIESTRGLRACLCLHGGEMRLPQMQEEAVRRRLYRYMGERYGTELEGTLRCTRTCIGAGRITSDDELRRYLTHVAVSLVRSRDFDLVINDLLTEARQTELYCLIDKSRSRLAGERPNCASPTKNEGAHSMTSAYLLPTVHLAITRTAVWAFFVALSLITIECIVIARSNRFQQRSGPAGAPNWFNLPSIGQVFRCLPALIHALNKRISAPSGLQIDVDNLAIQRA